MLALSNPLRRTSLAGACLCLLGWHSVVPAAPVDLSFDGVGNVVVFDPLAGSGGWVGALDEVLDPGQIGPARSYVAVVSFGFDTLANALQGQFEFTDAQNLASTLFGTVSGAFTGPTDSLLQGGQWALDYTVAGGTGEWLGATGFGLSFLSYDLGGTGFNNYSEQVLLVLEVQRVPLPSTVSLVLAGLALLGLARRGHRAQRPTPLGQCLVA